jgi:23S rRNA pseudouridine1911/1915/1917 synthase
LVHGVPTAPDQTYEVDAGSAGQRLDQFLGEFVGSRSHAARLIEQGLVTVGGGRVQKRYSVAQGDLVAVASQRPSLTEAPRTGSGNGPQAEFTVAYEDDDLLVVDKPAGVVVHPARGHREGTLAQALEGRAAGGEDPYRAGIVHRLDRDTSGLLVVAKSEEVHRKLKALLQARGLRREYLALVDGLPPARTGTIDAPIGRDRRDRVVMSLNTDVPRDARTHFELVEQLPTSALLRINLETGRTHQIRAHMLAIGYPVCGDPTYGDSAGRYGLTRQFLHATRLAFPHPVGGRTVDVSSPLPEDLAEALELARRG